MKPSDVARKAEVLGRKIREGELAGFELGDLVNENPPKMGRPKKSTESVDFSSEWWVEKTGLSATRVRGCAQAARLCLPEARKGTTVDRVLAEHRAPKEVPVVYEEDDIEFEARLDDEERLEYADPGPMPPRTATTSDLVAKMGRTILEHKFIISSVEKLSEEDRDTILEYIHADREALEVLESALTGGLVSKIEEWLEHHA